MYILPLICYTCREEVVNRDLEGRGKTLERIKGLNRYQKGVLLFMAVMVIAFSAAYFVTLSRVGFSYRDTILVPSRENGGTVYSGELNGQPARFTVSEDQTVTFQHGDKTYGPYTAKEDPTAIPKDVEIAAAMVGVELLEGDSVLFRGGVLELGNEYWLYNEDGTPNNFEMGHITITNEIELDEGGNDDPVEPSVSTILRLMNDPELTHKGEWIAWFGAMFICVLNAVLILFADEVFRWNLKFQIRDVEHAEPSELEIAGRYFSWTVLTILALVLFILGLQ